jgi:FtsP/CotA-like multicopper oxidase with cupredoxin domain
MSRRRLRALLACLATAALLGPLAYLWATSLMPDDYSVMGMGYEDFGGGIRAVGVSGAGDSVRHSGTHAGGISVTDLVDDPEREPDVTIRMVARAERFDLASGRSVAGFTLNGESPGPTIRAVEGQMVEVRLVNESVPDGMTLHWHGLDVPNAMDGVAGVTQDAVQEGESYTYRFVADQVGTFWYHSHQVSHEQVRGGLLGALVVDPKHKDARVLDVSALVHLYEGVRTVNGEDGELRAAAAPGTTVRVRVINTDNGPMPVWVSGTSYRVLAVDGTEVNRPTPVTGKAASLTAGGRYDLEVVMPQDGSGVRVELGGNAAVVLGSESSDVAETPPPSDELDLLSYGSPAAIGFDPADATRSFEYVIGRRPGFLNGRPGFWWTINGHMFPNVPMFMVSQGDIVTVHIENKSGKGHPMHLHGHHVVVLGRDGVAATGSPWWTDSLDVADGEEYDVAFLADNPGVWMDHCHNLPHAAEGLVSHLMYTGFRTPFKVGGNADNEPE